MGRSAKLRKQRKAEFDEALAVQVFGSVVYPRHLLSPLAASLPETVKR
ncbi:hypothetical protein K4A83_05670 [Spirulina subsalsa FACHB-351]|uniref:Uncharacterized protein n=1 Tax=Spirulina subsalsa FACHB-351 TaxID=234711 RepID=A0ABT3L2T1_9CYAN|nr:hypothetical protein [Spirulina subsalsa]MCW6035762.1 hypothetical protein [Spirulina subsalsa FACHB-351]